MEGSTVGVRIGLGELQANATFGKTTEQVRNRVNVRLIVDPNKLLKAVAKVSFRESEIINQHLVMVRGARTKITLNKPFAVGFSILEISKFIMYLFTTTTSRRNMQIAVHFCSPTQTACVARSGLTICMPT